MSQLLNCWNINCYEIEEKSSILSKILPQGNASTGIYCKCWYQIALIAPQLNSKMGEKLCLQWNDFQDNVRNAFGSLRDTNDFIDVTLACDDGRQIEAHKVVLAASSPFF